MDIKIIPKRLSGTIAAIPSKAFAHRLLIAAALSDKPGLVQIGKLSEDIEATMRCIEAMGAGVAFETDMGACNNSLTITPIPKTRAAALMLNCGESGSTARFLLPLAAHLFDSFEMTGEGKLKSRPFYPICRTLSDSGYEFFGGALPTTLPLSGRGKLQAGDFFIEGNISSQFISGLLFALPLLGAQSRINITTPLESAPYVDMTISVLRLYGIVIQKTAFGFSVPGNQKYHSPGALTVEGDWSNAAFFLCMGALGGPVSVTGLAPGSTQGDKEVLEILGRFGYVAATMQNTVTTEGAVTLCDQTTQNASSPQNAGSGGRPKEIEIDASQIPDLIPVLAAVASVSNTHTRICNTSRLRLKESDRIQSTFDMLSALGANIRLDGDDMIIYGREKLRGGEVDGAKDHRIVMAAATAACACENPVVIRGAEAVGKSYPGFFEDYKALGGEVIDISNRE